MNTSCQSSTYPVTATSVCHAASLPSRSVPTAKHQSVSIAALNGIPLSLSLDTYSEGREKLFERERHKEPVSGWHCCELACEAEHA